MTRLLLHALEWLAAGIFAVCMYLTWAGDLVSADAHVPHAAIFLTACLAVSAGLWAREIAQSHAAGLRHDRACARARRMAGEL